MTPATREVRHFLSTRELGREELTGILDLAERMKRKGAGNQFAGRQLAGRTLGLIFFDRSLRTRVSFEVAMVQLGGHCVIVSGRSDLYELEPEERAVMDGRAEEHVKDAASALSRYLDALAVRHLGPRSDYSLERNDPMLTAYARHATVPVINMESQSQHPCQAVADIMTMKERAPRLEGRRLAVAWTNQPETRSMGAVNSLVHLAVVMGMRVRLVHPLGYELDHDVLRDAEAAAADTGGGLEVANDLESGVEDADFVYARSWGSIKYYGDPEREALVKRSLASWKVTREVMARTAQAWFLHPLPVRRNVDVSDDVLDGEHSAVYDQAENRLHTQKAILVQLLR